MMAIALFLLLVLTSHASAVDAVQPPLVAYLLRSEGKVELKRTAWTSFYPAQAGTRLHAGDQLRLAHDARAVILCADFETAPWRPARGVRSAVEDACPRRPELIRLPDGLAAGTRVGQKTAVRVLSPRGLIRDEAPRIRWVASRSGEYEVRVLEGSRSIWGWVLVSGSEQQMPPDVLVPDFAYRVQVRRYREKAYVETEIPFTLIAAESRRKVRVGEGKLLALFPEDSTERKLAHALYLVHQHLWGEALRLLDGVLLGLQSSAAELLGGRLALGLGLGNEASTRLTRARSLAQGSGDLESEAAALVALASTAAKRDQKSESLAAALALYEKLGDGAKAEDVRGRL